MLTSVFNSPAMRDLYIITGVFYLRFLTERRLINFWLLLSIIIIIIIIIVIEHVLEQLNYFEVSFSL